MWLCTLSALSHTWFDDKLHALGTIWQLAVLFLSGSGGSSDPIGDDTSTMCMGSRPLGPWFLNYESAAWRLRKLELPRAANTCRAVPALWDPVQAVCVHLDSVIWRQQMARALGPSTLLTTLLALGYDAVCLLETSLYPSLRRWSRWVRVWRACWVCVVGRSKPSPPSPATRGWGSSCRGARTVRPCFAFGVPAYLPSPPVSPSPASGRGGLWSAEAKLPPTLKLTLQHSKQVSARLPSPTMWERGWG
jgi:hypothetical protein